MWERIQSFKLRKVETVSRISNKNSFSIKMQKWFSLIPAVKWHVYNIFYLRHWKHKLKEAFEWIPFIEISYKVTSTSWLVFVCKPPACFRLIAFCDNRLINVWCHDHRFSARGIVDRRAHCLRKCENVWLKGAFALGFIRAYCYFYQWSILL